MTDRKPGEFNIDFMGRRHLAVLFSALLLVGSAVSLAVNGLKLGIDFTGGTLVELGYAQPADLDGIRATLAVHPRARCRPGVARPAHRRP